MDSLLENFPGSLNGCMFGNGPVSVFSNQNPGSGLNVEDSSSPSNHSELAADSGPSAAAAVGTTSSSNGESGESSKHSNPILRYISDILMDEEDDLERKPCMLQDCLRLQAAEKSFYDVLGRSYPSSPHQVQGGFRDDNADPDDGFGGGTTSSEGYSSNTTDTSCESDLVNGAGDFESYFRQRALVDSPGNSSEVLDGVPLDPLRGTQPGALFSNGALDVIQWKVKPQVIQESVIRGSAATKGPREKRGHLMNNFSHVEEERSNKLSAVYSDDSELSEMFDEVLLCKDGKSPSFFLF